MEHTHLIAILFSGFDECFYIFWKARTTITNTRIKELTSDSGIRTDATTYHIDICPYQFAKISDIIHKTNTGSQH